MDTPDIPQYVGRYRINRQIARGGMGRVYHATDELIGRDVAIKLVNMDITNWPELSRDSLRRQFEQEMRISGQLSNHNVVTIYDAGEQDNSLFLVMELLDGVTLDKVISGQADPLDMRQKLEALTQVGQALHYAHQRGVIHRDIKPSNVMALPSGQIKVMDFGVAYAVGGAGMRLKDEPVNLMGGTPFYMSPEQINQKPLDGRSDLFSLAVVAYELLSGVRPFTATDRFALYEKILRVEPRPLREINPGIPERIAAIISICLNKDPSLRLPSCAAFAAQLDEVINESYFTGAGEAVTQETLNIIRQYRENFPFFFDLDNAQVYRLLQVCKARDFKQGEVIFEEGTVAREMFLLISGKVRISRRHAASDSLVILTLKRGEVFGEMGIIDGGPRSASATAETDCRALALHQVSLLRCDDNTAGKLYRNLAHILSAKLRVTSARLEDFSRRPNIS